MTEQAVTANRLGNGVVVYLTAQGAWSERLEDAARADGAAAEAMLAEAEAQPLAVVGPYLIDLAEGENGLELASVRERIRAAGPSVRLDHGKQAGN